MKQIAAITLLLVLISISCKKDEKALTPTTPTPASPTMTLTESSLVGKWYWDKSELWSGGSLVSTQDHSTHPAEAGAYMDLRPSLYNGTANPAPQLYDNVSSMNGTSTALNPWHVVPAGSIPKINLYTNAPPFSTYGGYIDSLSSTNLVITEWSGSVPNGMKNFYHK